MSAPSENMPIAATVSGPKPLLLRHSPYFIGAAIVVALAATMQFDGYVHNILMQATTFAIAVFGLSVVLGLCGQINLAQAAFFGFGAYAVGIGTSDYQISYWLCLVGGLPDGAGGGRVSGHVDVAARRALPRDGDDLVPADRHAGHDQRDLAHAWAGRRLAHRPARLCSSPSQAYLAFCVAMLAIVGYVVWHLPDTRLGRAMRAVRDNELAAGVIGIDVFRTKVSAFALSAVLGGLAGGLFAGGFAYVSPDQFSFAESVVFLTMSLARRRGVADRFGHRHRSPDPDPGMAALPQERSGTVSRDLRSRSSS